MPSAPLLLPLLVLATALVTAVAAVSGNYQLLCGMAIAQVQLMVAATVLFRRALVLRIAALIACLLVWTIVLALPHRLESFTFTLLLLLTVALFTSAWCGLLAFSGWRMVCPCLKFVDASPRYQFSLATMLLISTIACILGGLWRSFDYSFYEYSVLMQFLLCSLAGCTMLKLASRGTWPWLPIAAIAMIVGAALNMPSHRYLLPSIWSLPVLAMQTIALFVMLLTLRVSGIYLQRGGSPSSSAARVIIPSVTTIDSHSVHVRQA